MVFNLGKIFHLIHVTDDFEGLDTFYQEVFGGIRFSDGQYGFTYLDLEKRNASLLAIASAVVEPMSSAFEVQGWDETPIGRFYQKFGSHWHSLAWYVDDSFELYNSLSDNDVRFFGIGGVNGEPNYEVPLFTHPRDTVCLLEFIERRAPLAAALPDPRFTDPNYAGIDWPSRTPLGVEDLAYMTVTTKDLDRARTVFVNYLGGSIVGESSSALTGTHDVYVQVGQNVVQLSNPLGTDSLAAVDLEKHGESVHSVAWRVRDIGQARDFLQDRGISLVDQDAHTLLADPENTFGAYYRFTDAAPKELATT